MSVYVVSNEPYDPLDLDEKDADLKCITSSQLDQTLPTMEAEKRIRREIANSNERRRMQSINNGFQSLRSLLPHHEGEKLSKAAILQQTAEYIYSLEQEKTRLLSQNCQLKRLVNQHEGGDLPPKKRKAENGIAVGTESSDEGVGSMSPEPVALIDSPGELLRQLDRERALRRVLEEQIRQFEGQLLQQQEPEEQQSQIFQMPPLIVEEIDLQVVAADSLPPVGSTQTVECSSPDPCTVSPEMIETSEVPQCIEAQTIATLKPGARLPSVLEAAIKAEPKVEVERLPSPDPDDATQSRIYVSNTSRQNLETIVEAIRHLEGDHLFGDEPHQVISEDGPLALTTSIRTVTSVASPNETAVVVTTAKSPKANITTVTGVVKKVAPIPVAAATTADHILKAEMSTLLEFHAKDVEKRQKGRPGVIVIKQVS